jgi:predicted RNA-binding protein with PUA-like domain
LKFPAEKVQNQTKDGGAIMPNYWLLKTEPGTYSYDNLERERKVMWDGVANALALKHLRSMRRGDLAFIYHTGDEKQIVGIAEVASDPYPDPKQDDSKLVVVDLKPRNRLPRAVTLAEIKAAKEFAEFALVRIGRLSVMPVTAHIWARLGQMARQKG